MDRTSIINRIGIEYHTSNIENGEYSYIKAAGSKKNLIKALGGRVPEHYKLDIRFEDSDTVILVETKQNHLTSTDEDQLREYLLEERAINYGKKCICVLASILHDTIKVWKSAVDSEHLLPEETVLDTMAHYKSLFYMNKVNDREKVLKKTYALNELLHKMDIDEKLRSQFVGTILLYIKKIVQNEGASKIDNALREKLNAHWQMTSSEEIIAAIKNTLNGLLNDSDHKTKKIELLQNNILNNQKIKKLTLANWIEILNTVLMDIYKYIDADSSEGQDILNMFFIAFNKYTGKADKNQAFTPDHITEFMCRLTEVDRTKVVLDGTCGSGSFLVQAMVKEFADCSRGKTEAEAKALREIVSGSHIYGIEADENVYGLATTNMLIHGDGNSNIKLASLFDCKKFIETANPDIILMNPPYNAKPIGIPEAYKSTWGKAKESKEDPTKGFVFIQFLSDVIKEMNTNREKNGESHKEVKLAVLLPVSAAIGTSRLLTDAKKRMLENNTLEAVFTLPDEIFYPGASASACCMLFTLGRPHVNADKTAKETFFGYCKEDGFKKKKNLGRIEQFDSDGNSKWKAVEQEWLRLYWSKTAIDGLSATAVVDGNSEWLCEAYMKTDYNKLTESDFQQTINNYLAYLIREGKIHES
ncbi:MAG: SAM-dependent methyltransferase [Lachnospiraceae bacterium]|nr:SAM-dependent methyltransferase [Lachnospiraceae bacterium]